MLSRRVLLLWGVVLVLLLAACADDDDPPGTTPAAPTQEVAEDGGSPSSPSAATSTAPTATPTATPTPTDTPEPSPTPTATRPPTGPVTVCLSEEPPSLYLYGPASYAADVIHEVVYDGPVDTREYSVQPVILEKIPSLADGDAHLETVSVQDGDWVVDTEGKVVRLRTGINVRPAGCTSDACAITYVAPPTAGDDEADDEDGQEDEEEEDAAVLTPTLSLEMDQLVADFVLLPGITWSDGTPLTAADSVFSFQVAQEAQLPPRQRTGDQGVVPARTIDPVPRTASYTAVNSYTVRWVGLPGYLDPYYQSNFFSPLPEHQLGDYTPEELLEAPDSAQRPLGWGPYILVEWEPGQRIVAERNPNYFRADEQLPYFDRVIFRFDGDPESYLQDLESGECDVVARDALDADYQQYRDLEAEGAVRMHAVPGSVWEHLDFGINPIPGYDWRGDFFEDPRVRQAVAHCIDRQRIADELTFGLSVVPDAYIPPAHPLYGAAELTAYNYDPEAGIALLNEAGWRDTNGDGVAESYGIDSLQDGTTLIFNYTATSSPLRQQIAEMVIADLAECNIRVNRTEPVAPQTFFTPGVNSPIFGRQFDVTSFAWFADALPPCHLYLSSEIPTLRTNWSGFNVSGYESEAYDAACQSARGAAPGTDAYRDNHLEALRIFNQELPAVPLFMHLDVALARPELEGLLLDATEPVETWNVENFRRTED
ncbi:MAG: peptide ABC transporter substrate-binding protein [Candidatus Promineifilaceae bacterium]|nr:peptide ABC transporter substrate-binding protein [Candidatus Promineifilaceae bacterium]